jgi:hypothetical protein
LVACATFLIDKNGYNLNRYATKYNVVGGFSKILNHFTKIHNPKYIITYADQRWSDGNLYEKTGFIYQYTTTPLYDYVIGDKRYHRKSFTRTKLQNRLQDKFDPALTEAQNANNQGWYRIWNCGLKKYILIP